jgi:hypothetical protein
VTDPYPPIDAANDVCAIYDCLPVLASLQNDGNKFLRDEENKYAKVFDHFCVSRTWHSV